jgi:hypothetical protein
MNALVHEHGLRGSVTRRFVQNCTRPLSPKDSYSRFDDDSACGRSAHFTARCGPEDVSKLERRKVARQHSARIKVRARSART